MKTYFDCMILQKHQRKYLNRYFHCFSSNTKLKRNVFDIYMVGNLVQQLAIQCSYSWWFQNYYKAKHVYYRSFDAVIMCFTRVCVAHCVKRTLPCARSIFHTAIFISKWLIFWALALLLRQEIRNHHLQQHILPVFFSTLILTVLQVLKILIYHTNFR